MTNGDKIRASTDEELVEFIAMPFCDRRTNEECKYKFFADCHACRLAWLKEEVDENG